MVQQISISWQKLQDVLNFFKQCGRYNIDLSDYLKRFSKNSVKENLIKKILRPVRMAYSKYDVYVYYGTGRGTGMPYYEVYFDATCSFILIKSGKAICNIGFDIHMDNNIVVRQIQGVKGKQKELSLFRWEKMLLQILIDWAKQNGFKQIDVIRSRDNSYYNLSRAKSMYLRYDVIARRMGFVYNEEIEAYSLRL